MIGVLAVRVMAVLEVGSPPVASEEATSGRSRFPVARSLDDGASATGVCHHTVNVKASRFRG